MTPEPATARFQTGRPTGRPKSEEVDGAIHRATLLLLAEAGYEGLSIAQVARLAGTATTSVYRRFPGKQELVIATLRNELRARPGNPPDDCGFLRADLIEYVSGIAATLTPQSARIMAGLLLPMRSNEALAAVVRQEFTAMRSSNWQIIVDRAVARGEITQDHPGSSVLAEVPAAVIFRRGVVLQLPVTAEFVSDLVESVLLPALTNHQVNESKGCCWGQ